ncbi:MAG: (Fe-S)-binding protein [Deltaproteobacteria bacterium]|nr:(Fe-S)-binding protein [Deltaproteobacteria bacterium]
MYVLLIPTVVIFFYGLYSHIRLWRIGKPEQRAGTFSQRLKQLWVYGFGHARILTHRYAGLFHSLIFSGFVVLFIGTLVVMVHEDAGLRIMQGKFYLYFQSLALDVFGLFAIIGVLLVFWRRYILKPQSLTHTWRDALLAGLLLIILLTGFVVEGLRLIAAEDPWAHWSPVGFVVGKLFAAFLPLDAFRPLHASLWWFHLLLVFGLIAWLPYSKLLHVITSSANIYFRSLEPKGAMLKLIELETAESFGVKSIDSFTWKGLLDLDACTECGRCQDACPAFATGKPLSPKSLILDLRNALHAGPSGAPAGDGAPSGNGSLLIGKTIQEETLWSCTTCMACMEVCPVFIEHVPKIVDMRRYLVMEEGNFPDSMQQALRNVESRGHPYAGITASRLDWCRGLDVKIMSQVGRADYLYWVGCSTALNTRNQKIARALVQILQEAGVDFAILGAEENCTGDPARRMGNEYLFQTLARQNISVLNSYQVKKIVTTCPHCFNSLKNDYRQLGGNFEVYHHSELLARLIEEGKWKPSGRIKGKITFHDPCYLGRYNDTYDPPREVIGAVSGSAIVEMDRHREKSFCCGAGGGMMWAEEPKEKRVSNVRAQHAVETGADILSVACPFCMTMLEEGVKSENPGKEIKVVDIAELLRGMDSA